MIDRDLQDNRIHNPLPEPVQGKREDLTFPIQDIDSVDWNTANSGDIKETGARQQEGSAALPVNDKTDDFDVQISEGDDFDL